MELETVILWVFAVLCTWRLGETLQNWWRKITVGPDPWDTETTEQLKDPASLPVCHHCFTPQEHDRWFCPQCGGAVGPYNNWLPFISVFSEGEVARNAVYNHVRPTPLTIVGYLFFGAYEYFVFAPVFWFFFLRNLGYWSAPRPPELEAEHHLP